MDNGYLIPANSKKSMLILGFFNKVDLIIFGSGIGLTFILLFIIEATTIKNILFIVSPAIIVSFLVTPVPNHHNIRTFFMNVYTYFTSRRQYYWRGWCIGYGKK